MPISAAGNKPVPLPRGFTLVELMVVVAIVALASAGTLLALRTDPVTGLEREATRLASLLDTARARSRLTGQPVQWVPHTGGFDFMGLPPGTLPDRWLDPGTFAVDAGPVNLGPEPVIGAQRVRLARAGAAGVSVTLATDGLQPFTVQAGP